MTLRILIAEPDDFSSDALKYLRQTCSVECRQLRQADIRASLEDYDAVWIRLALQVRDDDIPCKPRCRYLITATTGTDHVDEKILQRAGITVLSLRGQRSFLDQITSTAEFALALILALARHIPFAFDDVRAGRWERDRFVGRQLAGLSAGIVGYGRLGCMLCRYLMVLGMNVLTYDISGFIPESGVKRCETLAELLGSSDIVSLHVNLNETNKDLFSEKEFNEMKKGALFVNTSRGALVDEIALLDALKSGQLGGAALDTIRDENSLYAGSALIRYAAQNHNLILTPHIGGASIDARKKCELFMAEQLMKQFLYNGGIKGCKSGS